MSDLAGSPRQPSTVVLGRYEVIKRLTSGGMGDIYLARQVAVAGFERLVILKSILPDLAEDPTFLSQFLDEARVVATLNHPNIVSVIEVAEWEGGYLLAMEYIQGVDLARLLRESRKATVPVPVRVTAGIIRDAAAGLDYAHRALDTQGRPLGIVHRDISPQNVMVRPDGVVKIVDFGIAAAANRLARTQGDTIKGKLRYMAPEQLVRGPLDGRCDQWALGVLTWEMLVGEGLFRGETPFELAAQVTQKPIPPPSSMRGDVPPGLDALVLRMLERDPAQRFATCAEVAHGLDRYLFDSGGPAGTAVGTFVTQVAGAAVTEKTRDLAPSTPLAPPVAAPARAAEAVGDDVPTRRVQGADFTGPSANPGDSQPRGAPAAAARPGVEPTFELDRGAHRAAATAGHLDALARAAQAPLSSTPRPAVNPVAVGLPSLGSAPLPAWVQPVAAGPAPGRGASAGPQPAAPAPWGGGEPAVPSVPATPSPTPSPTPREPQPHATDPFARPRPRDSRPPVPGQPAAPASRVVGTPPPDGPAAWWEPLLARVQDLGIPLPYLAGAAGAVVVLLLVVVVALVRRGGAPEPLPQVAASAQPASQAARISLDEADTLMKEAREALDEGNFVRARDIYVRLREGGDPRRDASAALERLSTERSAHEKLQEASDMRRLDPVQAWRMLQRIQPDTRAGIKAGAMRESMRGPLLNRLAQEAQSALEDGNYQEAKTKCRQALDVEPQDGRAATLLTKIRAAEQAEEREQNQAHDEDDGRPRRVMEGFVTPQAAIREGREALKARDAQTALAKARDAISLDEKSVDGYEFLGDVRVALQQPCPARKAYAKCMALGALGAQADRIKKKMALVDSRGCK
jgi:tetratricopeptide (TPR) repeat protein